MFHWQYMVTKSWSKTKLREGNNRKYYINVIVRKWVSTPSFQKFQNHPPITRIPPLPPFLKISHPPTLLANPLFQVFLINRNTTVKLSWINTIHAKQQHNIGFFIFKFTLKFFQVLNVCYIINLYCRKSFSHPFNFFVVSKGILHV